LQYRNAFVHITTFSWSRPKLDFAETFGLYYKSFTSVNCNCDDSTIIEPVL